jgi:Tol biopolymer transport system component
MRTPTLLLAGLALAQPALLPQTATDIHLFPMMGGVASLAGAKPRPMATENGYENQPFFDPDGRRVLFTANRDGKQTDIYEFDRSTGATRQLTRTPEGEYSPTVPAIRPSAASLAREGFTVIRMEADGTQRLWQFDRQGERPALVLTDIKPVGYHAWIDADRLALYVLGQPATLQLARVSSGKAETVARDIGRTLRVIPGSSRVSFVQREGEGAYSIVALDPASGRTEVLVKTRGQFRSRLRVDARRADAADVRGHPRVCVDSWRAAMARGARRGGARPRHGDAPGRVAKRRHTRGRHRGAVRRRRKPRSHISSG